MTEMRNPSADARIAWFSPFPPVRTGIAADSAGLVAALGGRGWRIDPYPETAAHDFPWTHRQRPYDLVVYQFGNSSHHDYIWPYALRYPGLVVLHDTRLHHARAALLLREKRRDEYRRELARNEPALDPDAAELAVAGFDSRLYYEWPMVRGLVERSRLVAVHGDATRRELVEALSIPNSTTPNSQSAYAERIVSIRLGHGQFVGAAQAAAARATIRGRYGIPEDAIVFGVFGGLTPEKRIAQVVAAFRATQVYAPHVHLLLGGAAAEHFRIEDYRSVAGVTITGYIEDTELTDHIASVDVSLNLRWPTARETSGPWLRALAAGVPTVVIDLLQLGDLPTLDPRTWQLTTPDIGYRVSDSGRRDAVAIAIDIMDEDHSLQLAMRRLAADADLRARLGRAGQQHWQREHTIEAMTDDYVSAIARCASDGELAAVGGNRAGIPDHFASGDETLRALLAPFGIETPW
jgi:glycosyltransferase involved in cell wall biosynthesis